MPKAGDENEKAEKKWRLIHDLAFPYDNETSINLCIPDENPSIEYHYIDEVKSSQWMLQQLLRFWLNAKCQLLHQLSQQPLSG